MTARTEFGFERTSCGCRECTVNCEHMPGYLIPADLVRLYRINSRDDEDMDEWARRALLASPGAVVARRGRQFRIPTLVPARREDGSCVHLKEGKCTVHEASPYGCAFMDAHLEGEEIDHRSAMGLQAIWMDRLDGGDYARLWELLHNEGLWAPSPEVCRARLREAWKKETGGTTETTDRR